MTKEINSSDPLQNSRNAVPIRSEYRYDPIEDRWALIAEGREARPSNTEPSRRPAIPREEKPRKSCPFCKGTEKETPETIKILALKEGVPQEWWNDVDSYAFYDAENAEGRDWRVRVVENKYPSFRMREDATSRQLEEAVAQALDSPDPKERFFLKEPSDGRCEVIVDATSCRPRSWGDFTDLEIKLTFRAFRDRLRTMRDSKRFAYALVFKNVGALAGASQLHSHSQLMATAALPSDVQSTLERLARLDAARRAREESADIWDALLDAELEAKDRVVASSDRYVLLCPFASRYPMQVEARPRFDAAFEDYDDESLDELALLLRDAVKALETAKEQQRPNDPAPLDHNVVMTNRPYVSSGALLRPKWTILPCLVKKAGFEIGTGIDINPVAPEMAAKILRAAFPVGRG